MCLLCLLQASVLALITEHLDTEETWSMSRSDQEQFAYAGFVLAVFQAAMRSRQRIGPPVWSTSDAFSSSDVTFALCRLKVSQSFRSMSFEMNGAQTLQRLVLLSFIPTCS